MGTFPPNSGVACLTVFNGDLIAAGSGISASVWRWDFDAPGTWQPIGQDLGDALIQTAGVYNGELLVGGYMDKGVVRFDGAAWTPLGGGLFLSNDIVAEVLAVFDLRVYRGDLIVAGSFGQAGAQQYSPGSVTAYHLARWNGSSWSAFVGLGNGCNDASVTLHEHDGELIVGGWLDVAGGAPNGHWARWGPHMGDLDGDGDVDTGDFELFADCLGLPGIAFPSGCDCADADSDGDVDLADFGMFQVLFSE